MVEKEMNYFSCATLLTQGKFVRQYFNYLKHRLLTNLHRGCDNSRGMWASSFSICHTNLNLVLCGRFEVLDHVKWRGTGSNVLWGQMIQLAYYIPK